VDLESEVLYGAFGTPREYLLTGSETAGKFRNVMLEKDGEDQLDRSFENFFLIY
jgi:hypothetical protein